MIRYGLKIQSRHTQVNKLDGLHHKAALQAQGYYHGQRQLWLPAQQVHAYPMQSRQRYRLQEDHPQTKGKGTIQAVQAKATEAQAKANYKGVAYM